MEYIGASFQTQVIEELVGGHDLLGPDPFNREELVFAVKFKAAVTMGWWSSGS